MCGEAGRPRSSDSVRDELAGCARAVVVELTCACSEWPVKNRSTPCIMKLAFVSPGCTRPEMTTALRRRSSEGSLVLAVMVMTSTTLPPSVSVSVLRRKKERQTGSTSIFCRAHREGEDTCRHGRSGAGVKETGSTTLLRTLMKRWRSEYV